MSRSCTEDNEEIEIKELQRDTRIYRLSRISWTSKSSWQRKKKILDGGFTMMRMTKIDELEDDDKEPSGLSDDDTVDYETIR